MKTDHGGSNPDDSNDNQQQQRDRSSTEGVTTTMTSLPPPRDMVLADEKVTKTLVTRPKTDRGTATDISLGVGSSPHPTTTTTREEAASAGLRPTRNNEDRIAMKEAQFLTESKLAANAVEIPPPSSASGHHGNIMNYILEDGGSSRPASTGGEDTVDTANSSSNSIHGEDHHETSTTTLQRLSNQESRPGAFNIRPTTPNSLVSTASSGGGVGGSAEHLQDSAEGLGLRSNVDQQEQEHYATSEDDLEAAPEATNDSDDGMAVADPVGNLEEAEEVKPEEIQEQSRASMIKEEKRNTRFLMIGSAAIILLVIAISVGVSRSQHQKKENGINSIPTVSTTTTATIITASPTLAPTALLSAKDIVGLVDLPRYTLDALQMSDSPQSLAMEWLSNHPNLPKFPQWKKLQLFVLVTFFYAMDGNNWPREIYGDWLDVTKDECYWFSDAYIIDHHDVWKHPDRYNRIGVLNASDIEICIPYDDDIDNDDLDVGSNATLSSSQFPGQYFHLGLTGVYGMSFVTGKVPKEVALLPHLKVFHITSNLNMEAVLEDVVPVELQTNVNLTSLQLWGNDYITGSMPEHVWKMGHLQLLDIGGNSVTGTLATQVGNLKQLTKFEIVNNAMTGRLPSQIGELSQLTTLIVGGNSFSGTLPREVWTMTSLEELSFDAYDEPYFPSEVGQLQHMELLHIHHNSNNGPIPTELFQLTNLTSLSLENCSFTGPIPTSFGLLSKLLDFVIPGNPLLTGTLPTELGLMKGVEWMLLQNTNVSGTLPSEVGLIPHLEGIVLHDTALTGSIPVEVCNISAIQEIIVDCEDVLCECPSKYNKYTQEWKSPCICHNDT